VVLGVIAAAIAVVVVVGLDWEGLDLRGEIEWEIGGSGEVRFPPPPRCRRRRCARMGMEKRGWL